MGDNIRILQVLPALNSGGVEVGAVDIAHAIAHYGWGSYIISNGGTMLSQLRPEVKHISMPVHSKNPIKIITNIFKLTRFIKENHISLIHVRSRVPAWSCYFAARICNIPLVTTFHGTYNFSNFIKKFYNSIMTRGCAVIAVSDFIKQHIVSNYNFNPSDIEVIRCGIDTNYFDPNKIDISVQQELRKKFNIPQNTPLIILPGRFTGWKGQLEFVQSLALIKEQNFYAIMVGDQERHPQYVNRVKEIIREHNLQDKVKLFGPEHNMRVLYSIGDIIISNSIEPEALGRIALEAQAMEKIILATNIGGAKETIEDGKTGFHFKPFDIKGLASLIVNTLSMPQSELKKIELAGRKAVIENFSLDLAKKKTLKIYQDLINRP